MHPESSAADAGRRYLGMLDTAERLGALGSWEWFPATGRLLWSDNHFRLFGWEPGAVSPSAELVLARVHAEDRSRVHAALVFVAAGGDVETLAFRITRPDGLVRHLRATIAAVDETGDGARRLAGSVQDVTSEHRVDRKLEAYAAVARAVDEWKAFEPGAEALLAALAASLDLAFGAVWISASDALCAKVLWPRALPALAAVAQTTEEWRPGHGSSTLGRAWETRQPLVCAQPWVGSSPQRGAAIRAAGFSAVVVLPAVAVDETLAVLEFLSYEPVEPTDRLLRVLTAIGHEIGAFLAHHRGELVGPVLTPRQRQILQLAGRSRSAADIADELYLSPATVKRHFEAAYAALGVSDRAAAVGEAMRRGLIT